MDLGAPYDRKEGHWLYCKEKSMSDFWLVAGPIAVVAVGWFVGTEISRLRTAVDKLSANQMQLAISLGRLEEKVK
jgi:hypothetical protein